MDATTGKLLDYYSEHLNELVAAQAITEAEAATAQHFANCIAAGIEPTDTAVAEAEQILREDGNG